MKPLNSRGAVLFALSLGLAAVPSLARAAGPPDDKKDHGAQKDHQDKGKDQPGKKDDRGPAKERGAPNERAARPPHEEARPRGPAPRAEERHQRPAGPKAEHQRQDEQPVPRAPRARPVAAPPAPPPAPRPANQPGRGPDRLSAPRQEQLIQVQRTRFQAYGARLEEQQRIADQRAAALQQQNRAAQYRFQQEYVARLRQQQTAVSGWSSYDYNSDPYFYTAPSYRYSWAGRTYQTNQYGADLLRQAVNYGYQEGVRAGEADRQDGYRFDYRSSYAYEDANYGYTGMYVDQRDYNYYFRQGFRRGYQDGYYSRFQYGRNDNGRFAIRGNVLTVILNLRSFR